jgi:bifunctional DNA-binding transcriptional regulator/antitoxin component of YhaV-PrlF toxin-antitoxin module
MRCMEERTTMVTIDELGRCTIPKPVRMALGIDGEDTQAEITVRIYNDED